MCSAKAATLCFTSRHGRAASIIAAAMPHCRAHQHKRSAAAPGRRHGLTRRCDIHRSERTRQRAQHNRPHCNHPLAPTVSALLSRIDRYFERLFAIFEQGKSVKTLKG